MTQGFKAGYWLLAYKSYLCFPPLSYPSRSSVTLPLSSLSLHCTDPHRDWCAWTRRQMLTLGHICRIWWRYDEGNRVGHGTMDRFGRWIIDSLVGVENS